MGGPTAYAAEFLGTFLLLLCILATNANPLFMGVGFAVILLLASSLSGAHINPAVSIVQYLRGFLPARDLAPYIASQVAGAVACMYTYKMIA